MKKRRKEKQKRKKHASGSASGSGEAAIIRRAKQYPIHECLLSGDWAESGMATVAVVRRQSETMIAYGVYLVDLYCLGVKDAFCRANLPLSAYKSDFRAGLVENRDARVCSVDLAHQIVYGALGPATCGGHQPFRTAELGGGALVGAGTEQRWPKDDD